MRQLRAAVGIVLAAASLGLAAPITQAAGVAVAWTAVVPASPAVFISGMVAVGDGVAVAGRVDRDHAIDDQSSTGGTDLYVVRFNANGSVAWPLQFGTVADDYFSGIDDTANAIFIAGTTYGVYGTNTYLSAPDGFVAKVSVTGTLLWWRQFQARGVTAVAAGLDGSVAVAAWNRDTTGATQAIVRTYASDGTQGWSDAVPSSNPGGPNKYAQGIDIAADIHGYTLLGGADGSVDPLWVTRTFRNDVWLRRYDYAGRIWWTKQFDEIRPHPDTGAPQEVTTTAWGLVATNNSLVVTGASNYPLEGSGPPGQGDAYPFVRGIGFDGQTRWTHVMAGSDGSPDCDGALVASSTKPDAGYYGGHAYRLDSDGTAHEFYSQDGSAAGEWTYLTIVRAGSRVFVARHKTVYDSELIESDDVMALTGVDEPTGCSQGLTALAPQVRLQTGAITQSKNQLPALITWSGFGGSSRIDRFRLRKSVDGGAWHLLDQSFLTPSFSTTLKPGHSYRFAARAIARNGTKSPWVAGPSFQVGLIEDTSSAATYTAPDQWSTVSGGFTNFSAHRSTTYNSDVTITVTGSSFSLVSEIGPTFKPIDVYIDGLLESTVSLNASSYGNKKLVFSRQFQTAGSHTVKLVIRSNASPLFDFDSLGYTR